MKPNQAHSNHGLLRTACKSAFPVIPARGQMLGTVGVYGVAHALVDASCAALVFSACATGRIPSSLAMAAVLLYNLLAFAMQPILGWFVNDTSSARAWARAGALLTVISCVVGMIPLGTWPAVILAGLGNAVFHIGGGVISLRIEPGRATAPGLFVAPGAAGLAAGIFMGANQWFSWLPALALGLTIPFLRLSPSSAGDTCEHGKALSSTLLLFGVVGMLFAVIIMRAFVGSGIVLPWKSEPVLLLALTAAVVLGKAAGGILADRFGRIAVGVGALCLSAPLLMVAPAWAAAGISGMLLFNMTMPVTLVAIADLMPERPGFAFGLTCLALVTGSLPLALRLVRDLSPVAVALWVLGSAALLCLGLLRAAGGHTACTNPQPDPKEA